MNKENTICNITSYWPVGNIIERLVASKDLVDLSYTSIHMSFLGDQPADTLPIYDPSVPNYLLTIYTKCLQRLVIEKDDGRTPLTLRKKFLCTKSQFLQTSLYIFLSSFARLGISYLKYPRSVLVMYLQTKLFQST